MLWKGTEKQRKMTSSTWTGKIEKRKANVKNIGTRRNWNLIRKVKRLHGSPAEIDRLEPQPRSRPWLESRSGEVLGPPSPPPSPATTPFFQEPTHPTDRRRSFLHPNFPFNFFFFFTGGGEGFLSSIFFDPPSLFVLLVFENYQEISFRRNNFDFESFLFELLKRKKSWNMQNQNQVYT